MQRQHVLGHVQAQPFLRRPRMRACAFFHALLAYRRLSGDHVRDAARTRATLYRILPFTLPKSLQPVPCRDFGPRTFSAVVIFHR